MTSREDWTESEDELIVDDYLDMLGAELKGERFNKAQHNRDLLPKLNGRSRGSIEFKHQNISSVLQDAGRPYIKGYKPLANAQRGLLGEIIDQKWDQFVASFEDQSSFTDQDEESTDWLSDVASCVSALDRVFTLTEVYAFETDLSSLHPESSTIRPSIRKHFNNYVTGVQLLLLITQVITLKQQTSQLGSN